MFSLFLTSQEPDLVATDGHSPLLPSNNLNHIAVQVDVVPVEGEVDTLQRS